MIKPMSNTEFRMHHNQPTKVKINLCCCDLMTVKGSAIRA